MSKISTKRTILHQRQKPYGLIYIFFCVHFPHGCFSPPFSHESVRVQEIYFSFCMGLPFVFPSAWMGTQFSHVEYEILTAAVTNNSVFWDITQCSPLKINRRFGGKRCLRLQRRNIIQERNQHEADSKL
jgi:hypothetical protein